MSSVSFMSTGSLGEQPNLSAYEGQIAQISTITIHFAEALRCALVQNCVPFTLQDRVLYLDPNGSGKYVLRDVAAETSSDEESHGSAGGTIFDKEHSLNKIIKDVIQAKYQLDKEVVQSKSLPASKKAPDGILNGIARRIWEGGIIEEGEFSDDKLIKGFVTYPSQIKSRGALLCCLLQSNHQRICADGRKEQGCFKDGIVQDGGSVFFSDDTVFTGKFTKSGEPKSGSRRSSFGESEEGDFALDGQLQRGHRYSDSGKKITVGETSQACVML